MLPWMVVCLAQKHELLMSDERPRRDRLASLVHGVLEHLTGLKIRVGALRLLVRRGAIAPADVEDRLIQIEQDIDTTAAQVEGVRAERSRST